MVRKMEEIIDAEITEVEEVKEKEVVQAPEQEIPQCEVRVGMDKDGKLYFNVIGTNQNLVITDGLLDYAKRALDRAWAERM